MTKADIIKEISQNTGIEKVTVEKAVEAFMETMKDSLTGGSNVYLRGFGSFIVKKRAEKTARNISKNTTVIVPAHNIPSFKPAKEFVAQVKEQVKSECDILNKNGGFVFNTVHNIQANVPFENVVAMLDALKEL